MGASPLQLVVMLYDGAIKFVKQGQTAMEEGRLFEQNEALQRAQRIVVELLSSLDMHRGGEVAKNLFGLYTFCYNELIAANVEDQPKKLDAVVKVLTDLRESWTQLEQQQRGAIDTGGSSDLSAAA
ncbi:MAG: flagellar export chaperone FliS [Chthonomonas sp.]|nr:flagellar export chaperone FliS [Chthonomonas sp.]